MSPEMGELSMDKIPQAPPAPLSTTEQGVPSALLEQIKLGKSLKHTETKVKTSDKFGNVINENNNTPSSSKVTIDNQTVNKPSSFKDALSAKFDQIKKAVSGSDDDDNDISKNV
jgi:hypothetical protein